ncbi:MAG: hypothetical protein E6J91_06220 [Deltaproteobacteria bacterium]|nr:MAG: hypothetical protein E6J91_06220 [Deltaproteobacteria bacterium]
MLEHHPGDEYAAAKLRATHVAAGATRAAIDLDLQLARDTGRAAPLLRAAAELADDDQADTAIDALMHGREDHPACAAIADALADALAEAGRWSDRARLLGGLAGEPGAAPRDIARLRAALAWDRAARAATADADERKRTTIAALDAWDHVLEDDPRAAVAHAARLVLASQLGDPDILIDVLARAQAAERSPWAASSLALRRARLLSSGDARLAEEVARDAAPDLDDPRRTLVVMMAAAQRRELGEAATALEDRAARLAARTGGPAPSLEAAVLRLRAAQLALDADDARRAIALLVQVDPALPGLAGDLIDAARWRAGEPPVDRPRDATRGGVNLAALPRERGRESPLLIDIPAAAESFVRAVRDAELAAARGHGAAALALYQRALEIRAAEPLAAEPLVRLATALREPSPIAALALEQLRTAEAMADTAARADAFELLARADELRGDAAAVTFALETAAQTDPGRLDLLHRLARELASGRRPGELLRLRERQLDQLRHNLDDAGHPVAGALDVVALAMDAAILAVRARASDAALVRFHRAALEADPRHRPAQLALYALLGTIRAAGRRC